MPRDPNVEKILKRADTFLEKGPSRHPRPFPAHRFLTPRNLDDQLIEEMLEKFPLLGLQDILPGGETAPFVETLRGLDRTNRILPSIAGRTTGMTVQGGGFGFPDEDDIVRPNRVFFTRTDPNRQDMWGLQDTLNESEFNVWDSARHHSRHMDNREAAQLLREFDRGSIDATEFRQRAVAMGMVEPRHVQAVETLDQQLRQWADADKMGLVPPSLPEYHLDVLWRHVMNQDDVVKAAIAQKAQDNPAGISQSLRRHTPELFPVEGGYPWFDDLGVAAAYGDKPAHDLFKRILGEAGLEGSAKLGTIGKGLGGIVGGLGLGALARKHTDEDSLAGQFVRRIL